MRSMYNSVSFSTTSVGLSKLIFGTDNNYCGLNNFANANDWNFATWYVVLLRLINRFLISCRDNWAKTTSPNKNVKIYIGAPASSTAAGSGYVPISELTTIIQQTKAQYSSFGGVMLWDASQAYSMFIYIQYLTNKY